MYVAIVHKKGGVLYFDDVPVTNGEIPRRVAFAGRWYATPNVQPTDIFPLLRAGDTVFGPAPGRFSGARFRLPRRRTLTVFSGSLWGIEATSHDAFEAQLDAKLIAAAGSGFSPGISAAGTAVKAYMKRYDGRDGRPLTRQLPPRFRGLAQGAFFGGPLFVTRGSSPMAAHIDIKGAYLHALSEPVPVHGLDPANPKRRRGGWFTYEAQWDEIRDLVGFVEATVWVDPDVVSRNGIASLPIRTYAGSVFPSGLVRGAWPIASVAQAEELGEATVMAVHQWCYAPETEPLFESIARDFESAPDEIAKTLYCRFWGRWGSRGGYTGMVGDDPPDGAVRSGGIWWSFDGVDHHSWRAPPTYRPDIAALIAGYTHRRVMAAVHELSRDTAPGDPPPVVAAHVDAIWTDNIAGAKRLCHGSSPGDWQLKRVGPLRFYGTGCYDHDGKLGAAGYDKARFGPLTRTSIADWAGNSGSRLHRLLLRGRNWASDPATNAAATSEPLFMDMDESASQLAGPDVSDVCWTPNGWVSTAARRAFGLP